MNSRTPARWMAPLALLVAVVAVWVIIGSTTGGDEGPSAAPGSTSSAEEQTGSSTGKAEKPAATTPATTETEAAGPETFTVKPGDTLGSIAASSGVTVEELIELNPDLDPQSLTVGDTVRLRR